ncbi:MAG: class I SAM-dependent methyltransferase [Planctomycetales bacterium]
MTIKRLLKSLTKEVTPPFLFRGMRSMAHLLFPGGERQATWYDADYADSEEYRKHYTESMYYFMWTVVADRLLPYREEAVLDLGCGPGQFGSLLHDKGFQNYCGLDFSPQCVELARRQCPTFDFVVADILQTDLLETRDYDCVVSMEFLEHVEEDLEVLERVKPGTRTLGTVPDFPYPSHVRHFTSAEEVESRYGALFSSFRVDDFPKSAEGPVFYLFEGIKR